MYSDTEEIKQIMHAADILQTRIDKLAARKAFTPDQHVAAREAADGLRRLRGYQLAELQKQLDPEYAEEMKKLTELAKK